MSEEPAALVVPMFTVTLNDEVGGIGLIDGPVPATDLAGPAATTWLWPEARRPMTNS